MDAYVESPEQAQVNDLAVQELAYSCMKERGFKWSKPVQNETSEMASSPMNARRYGVIEGPEVRKWGYHPPSGPDSDSREQKNLEKEFKPDARAVEAYMGVAPDEDVSRESTSSKKGCLGRAQADIFGERKEDSKWKELLKYHSQSFLDASRDPGVVDAMARWSTCMKGLGYNYANIWGSNNDPRWQVSEVSATEISTATHDVRCKRESRVPTVLLSVETKLQADYIRRHAKDFSKIKHNLAKVYEHSLEVVGPRRAG
ncbi:hypothetical protein ACN6LM_005521 [Streptomyces sp. SAS_281]|uniref:hypothetical protein n=1 Tax=Streptomyces sp. SAS_281 TaxID=3412744 RepID=UPI00403C4223